MTTPDSSATPNPPGAPDPNGAFGSPSGLPPASAAPGSGPAQASPPVGGPGTASGATYDAPPASGSPYGAPGTASGATYNAPPASGSPYGAAPSSGPAYGAAPSSGPAYGAPAQPGAAQSVPPSGSAPGGAPWSTPVWPEPRPSQAPGLVAGVVLVVVGAMFLVLRLGNIALGPDAWPLWLVVPGLAMVIGSLFIPSRGALGLAIPGAIIAVVGGVLWAQEATGLYATWAYAWALVAPTAPGLAMLLLGVVQRDGELFRDGLRTTVTGIGLFLGFGLFFEGVVGISGHRIENLDTVLPYAAIGLGALLIVVAFLDGGRRDAWRDQRRAERRAARDQRRAERAARRAAR